MSENEKEYPKPEEWPRILKALDLLEQLAEEELKKYPYQYNGQHNKDRDMLSNVPSWIRGVRQDYQNPYYGVQSEVLSCLDNLREVAIKFKFNLKGE